MSTSNERRQAADRGASAVEYALIVAGVAAAIIATVFLIQSLVSDNFDSQVSRICDPAICAGGGGGGGGGGTPLTVTSVSITSTEAVVTSASGGVARITAVVTPAQCTGRVDFTDTTPTPEVALPSSLATAGQAAIDALLSVGDHVISAVFVPDSGSGCAPSEQTATVTVRAATPTIVLTGPTSAAGTGPTTSVPVTGSFSPGLCAGTITVLDSGSPVGSTTVVSSTFVSVGFTVDASLTEGPHLLTAQFTPTGGLCLPATSGTLALTVTPAPPAVALTLIRTNNTNACGGQPTCRVRLEITPTASAATYEIERSTVLPAPVVPFAAVTTLSAAPWTWIDPVVALAAGQRYDYRVRGCAAGGTCSSWTTVTASRP